MAQKEIEEVKEAERAALDTIANSQKKAESMVRDARTKGEHLKKQELSKFRKEMKTKREENYRCHGVQDSYNFHAQCQDGT